MANTAIKIKRSSSNSSPVSLAAGELAYSYVSNVIFIGNSTGTGVVNIGGQYYTSQVDNATNAATGSTLVRRDASGNASFNYVFANVVGTIIGNANSATQLQTARDFSINGTDVESSTVSFDGTGNVVLQGNLKTTGVSAGTYGGQTQIPVFTVDSKGRLTSAANVSVATTLAFAADTGTGSLNLLTDTLTIAGRAGLSSIAVDANNTVLIDVDNTVVRANTVMGKQTIDGDVEISGNLVVLGTETIINVETLNIADPLLYLAGNNYVSDIVDIGFVGNYFDGSISRHAGVFRHAGNKQFYVFDNYDQEPSNNVIDVANTSFRVATLNANLTANTANVNQTLTLGAASQLYANGGAYFGGSPFVNGDLTANTNLFAPNLPNATTGNLVYFDTANGRFSYASDNALTPTSIANGSYSLSIQSSDGKLVHNGQGIQLANGAIIKDTSGDAVAFGQFAGTLSQGAQAVAIGDSAGYNTQGAYGVAIGYGAGNVNQGQVAIAIGLNAGINNQGTNGIAIGNSAGNAQGTGAIALGYAAASSSGSKSVAIGYEAGFGNTSFMGANTVAIGHRAGYESAFAGSIILNASGVNLSSAAAGLYINPVRYTETQDATYDGIVLYNSNTKEVRYSYALDGGNF